VYQERAPEGSSLQGGYDLDSHKYGLIVDPPWLDREYGDNEFQFLAYKEEI
jgi:hypothetical protein